MRICVFRCVFVRLCLCVCVRVCLCTCVHMWVCVCVHTEACVLALVTPAIKERLSASFSNGIKSPSVSRTSRVYPLPCPQTPTRTRDTAPHMPTGQTSTLRHADDFAPFRRDPDHLPLSDWSIFDVRGIPRISQCHALLCFFRNGE